MIPPLAPRIDYLRTRDGREPITRRVHMAHQRQVLFARLLLEQFRAIGAMSREQQRALARLQPRTLNERRHDDQG